MVGARLRGDRFEKRKALLFLLIVAGFVAGGVGGAFLFAAFAFHALLVPAVLCLALAIAFRLYRRARTGAR